MAADLGGLLGAAGACGLVASCCDATRLPLLPNDDSGGTVLIRKIGGMLVGMEPGEGLGAFLVTYA